MQINFHEYMTIFPILSLCNYSQSLPINFQSSYFDGDRIVLHNYAVHMFFFQCMSSHPFTTSLRYSLRYLDRFKGCTYEQWWYLQN